jgi:hypothetical protein
MTVPKSFEMVLKGEILSIGYAKQGQKTDPWTVSVNGKALATAVRLEQNRWEVISHRSGDKYLGRILQQAVMDCVRGEMKEDDPE